MSRMGAAIPVITGLLIMMLAFTSATAIAGHNPRLFTNKKGDHGGTFRSPHRARRASFWFSNRKRAKYLKVCIWKQLKRTGTFACKRFRVRRVPAASYSPWGIDFKIGRHYKLTKGAWNLRFRRTSGKNLSPVLGFHR